MNEAENRATKKITHKWFATWDGRQQMVQYAYEIWGMDLVTLIECENGTRDPFRKAYWEEDSRWYCMINRRWHKDIVDNQLFRNDWKWQIGQCYKLMVNWTKFYWRNRKINWVKCSDYVLSRFVIGWQ
jgi:hypothetical protein